jgi:hypothetical protein
MGKGGQFVAPALLAQYETLMVSGAVAAAERSIGETETHPLSGRVEFPCADLRAVEHAPGAASTPLSRCRRIATGTPSPRPPVHPARHASPYYCGAASGIPSVVMYALIRL